MSVLLVVFSLAAITQCIGTFKQTYPKADGGKLFTKCLLLVVTTLINLVDWGVIDPKKRQYRKSFLLKFVNTLPTGWSFN